MGTRLASRHSQRSTGKPIERCSELLYFDQGQPVDHCRFQSPCGNNAVADLSRIGSALLPRLLDARGYHAEAERNDSVAEEHGLDRRAAYAHDRVAPGR